MPIPPRTRRTAATVIAALMSTHLAGCAPSTVRTEIPVTVGGKSYVITKEVHTDWPSQDISFTFETNGESIYCDDLQRCINIIKKLNGGSLEPTATKPSATTTTTTTNDGFD